MPYLLTLLKSVWNELESAGGEEGLPGCEVVRLLAVVMGEFSLSGAGSGMVGLVAEGRWGMGRAYARLVAGRSGAKVREVVEEHVGGG
jgi:hypothetical protein